MSNSLSNIPSIQDGNDDEFTNACVGALVALKNNLVHELSIIADSSPDLAVISLVTGPPAIGKSTLLSPREPIGDIADRKGWMQMYDAEQIAGLGLDPYNSVDVATATFHSLIRQHSNNVSSLRMFSGETVLEDKKYISGMINPAGAKLDEVARALHFFFSMFGIKARFQVVCLWLPFGVYRGRLVGRTTKPHQDGLKKWHIFNEVLETSKGQDVVISSISVGAKEPTISIRFIRLSGMSSMRSILSVNSWRRTLVAVQDTFTENERKSIVAA